MRRFDRRLLQQVGERPGAFGAVDDPPIDKYLVMSDARPLHIGCRNPAQRRGAYGLYDLGVVERAKISFALQTRFHRVDASGDIDGEHQFEVDGLGGCKSTRRRNDACDRKETGRDPQATPCPNFTLHTGLHR